MELDNDYANGAYISGADSFPPRWIAQSKTFREALGARSHVSIPYGDGPRQVFDMFVPPSPSKGTVVFVHGGYWLAFDQSYWSYLAAGPLAHGWAVAMPSYDLCPDVRINQITKQIAIAVGVIAEQGDGPLALAGHSAGGHLVSRMLDREVFGSGLEGRLKAVVPISPVSDLRPLLRTSMNDDFQMDAAEAAAESPVLMTDRYDVPVSVWVGADERPAFLDQARWLAESWDADHVVVPGKHHFDVIDALGDPDSQMVRALID